MEQDDRKINSLDGIYVGGCIHFHRNYDYGYCNISNDSVNTMRYNCADNPNCYYKQRERLKKKLEEAYKISDEKLKETVIKQENEINRLESELSEAIGAIDNVRKAKEDLQKENRLLNELKDENSLRISQLVTKLCEIDSRCVELQKKCERLIQEKYELHDEIQTQKGQIHSLKEDLEAESKEAHRWYAEETDSFFAFLSVCGLLDRYKECLEAVKEMSKNANLPNISLYIESFLNEMSQKSFSQKVKDVMFTPDKEITESGLRRKDE